MEKIKASGKCAALTTPLRGNIRPHATQVNDIKFEDSMESKDPTFTSTASFRRSPWQRIDRLRMLVSNVAFEQNHGPAFVIAMRAGEGLD